MRCGMDGWMFRHYGFVLPPNEDCPKCSMVCATSGKLWHHSMQIGRLGEARSVLYWLLFVLVGREYTGTHQQVLAGPDGPIHLSI